MGDVYWGLHLPLAAAVRRMGTRVCYETGTYFGGGATQLAALFDRVTTIEASVELHEFCFGAYADVLPNVEFVHGFGPAVFRERLAAEVGPVLFVLDAHWFPSKAPVAGEEAQCPVMAELDAIENCPRMIEVGSVVIIDDADMFLRSLPTQFRDGDFPTLLELDKRLRDMGFEHVFVCDDVLVAGPRELQLAEREYLKLRALGRPGGKKVPSKTDGNS